MYRKMDSRPTVYCRCNQLVIAHPQIEVGGTQLTVSMFQHKTCGLNTTKQLNAIVARCIV